MGMAQSLPQWNSPQVKEPSPKVPKLLHRLNGADLAPAKTHPLLKVKRVSNKSTLPSRTSALSISYDLASAMETKVPARGKALIPTDLSIDIPQRTYGRIALPTELPWKHSIAIGAGVVDSDYRGPVGVILFNHSYTDFEVKVGDPMAQLIIQTIDMPEVSELKVKKLSQKATLPSRASALSAGYDLPSAMEMKVPARGKALIPTDLSIAIPEGTYGRIAPRSGLAWKHSIDVGAGVINGDYRGPVGVILFNHSDTDFEVKVGDRIAQLIFEKIAMPEVSELKVKKLSEKAKIPSRASALSAGYDLASAMDTKVPARGKALIPTDLSIVFPTGTYGRIAPRFGLAWKHSIDVGGGVIAGDYRGSVGVILFNHSDTDFEVKVGDPIAQLILQNIVMAEVLEVKDLDATERGDGGFGSTGVTTTASNKASGKLRKQQNL